MQAEKQQHAKPREDVTPSLSSTSWYQGSYSQSYAGEMLVATLRFPGQGMEGGPWGCAKETVAMLWEKGLCALDVCQWEMRLQAVCPRGGIFGGDIGAQGSHLESWTEGWAVDNGEIQRGGMKQDDKKGGPCEQRVDAGTW
ncbi:hypothetical protein P7K49_030961 [Saguinus oedipus]|uniref:Uncharacterized protein n=1 Tax=Saguinus oedipus TaxID=9490 RepID=A0ABQ9U3N2_SAGOE|nr:hypothetical protein P7K49_030961 [Saguinus oedipus]